MARLGAFVGPSERYGVPLAIVQPIDSKFPQFDPEIESLTGISDEKKAELQQQVDELNAALLLGRDID